MASHDPTILTQPGGGDDERHVGKQSEGQSASWSETLTKPEGRILFLHWVEQARRGPRKPAEPNAAKAFGKLYERFRPQLLSYLQWGRRNEQAEDQVNEAFISAWLYMPKWDVTKSRDPEWAFRKLLVLIADRKRKKLWDRQKRLTFLSYEELDGEPGAGEHDNEDHPIHSKLTRLLRVREDRMRHSGRYLSGQHEDDVIDPEDFVALTEFECLLAHLSPRERQCWQLRQAGYLGAEIAEIIAIQIERPIKETTVNAYICRANQRLAELKALESGR